MKQNIWKALDDYSRKKAEEVIDEMINCIVYKIIGRASQVGKVSKAKG
jgi:hypothetical protein